jgi:hypothetical protein
VNGQDSQTELFDVFLCHNSEDKPAVREIAKKLVAEVIKPWLDVEQIRRGTKWQTALGKQIKNVKSAAVLSGIAALAPGRMKSSGLSQRVCGSAMSGHPGDPCLCHYGGGSALAPKESPLCGLPRI